MLMLAWIGGCESLTDMLWLQTPVCAFVRREQSEIPLRVAESFPLGAGAGVPHDHTMCHTHVGMDRRPKEADARLPRGSHLFYSINNSSLSHSAWGRTHRAAWLPFPLRLLAHSRGNCHFRGLGCAPWRRNFAFFKVLAFKNYYLFKIAISQKGNSSATLPMKT